MAVNCRAPAAFQEITPNRMRGQVSAVYLFVLNLAGIGLGPTLVALMTENVFGGDASVRWSISAIVLLSAPMSALCLVRACKHYRHESSILSAKADASAKGARASSK